MSQYVSLIAFTLVCFCVLEIYWRVTKSFKVVSWVFESIFLNVTKVIQAEIQTKKL